MVPLDAAREVSQLSRSSAPPAPPPAPPTLTERVSDSAVDSLVTTTVAFVLALLVLAYLYLCCHVWGLHLRLLALVKCVGRSHGTYSPRTHRQAPFPSGRPSISLPVESAPPLPSRLALETPPPRYSLVNGSLPSYSCAMRRTMTVIGKPLHFRILVRLRSADLCPSKVGSSNSSRLRPPNQDIHSFSTKLPVVPPYDSASLGPSTSSPGPAVSLAESDHCCIDLNNNIPLASLHPDAISSSGESDTSSRGDDPGETVTGGPGTTEGDVDDDRVQPETNKLFEVADKYVKVVVQREGQEAKQSMLAKRTSPSCYEAKWTTKPEDLIANYTFQVYLGEETEADLYLEMLDADGLIVAVDQLSPVLSTRPPVYLTPAPAYVSP
ncbi:uncharacterized protein LOC122263047 [Penaeus japonicus]|uniref:uncharacterized protein LOC122263047 n=1 Tax=Penaeus japonicus TaxID=27405 RepID=UPI001C715B5A|nr:uncharacterized protein LOC122263047 [Penaeus japonicus]XP_042887279.1 uncharacterized protein LOC122263047 [Penaeus japonicus]XP_042887280.1 uncharacterized protein LOC122263047 [Penaeus japonicus]